MTNHLIYVDTCPVCEGGVCRVRVCGVATHRLHGLVICDECEAMWLEPDLNTPYFYADPANPSSPVDGDAIWSESNRWATVEDVALLGWYGLVRIEEDLTEHS